MMGPPVWFIPAFDGRGELASALSDPAPSVFPGKSGT